MIWKHLKYFNSSEFPNKGEYTNVRLLSNLNQARELIKQRIYPSMVEGALARFGGSKTSQHYVGEDLNNIIRKTTAIDVFAEGTPIENFQLIYGSGLFKGIGIYLDTNGPDGEPWVMFHLDIRDKGFGEVPLIWFAVKEQGVTKYRYPQWDNKQWVLFQRSELCKSKFK